MSLDVSLIMPGASVGGSGIFVRENGAVREITRAEWDEKFPGVEPLTFEQDGGGVYSANITHNLGDMANEAGIYSIIWHPDKNDIQYAYQLISPLQDGLARLLSDAAYFEQFNPPNGWGNYGLLVEFTQSYLDACKKYPHAKVSVWR